MFQKRNSVRCEEKFVTSDGEAIECFERREQTPILRRVMGELENRRLLTPSEGLRYEILPRFREKRDYEELLSRREETEDDDYFEQFELGKKN